VHEKHLRALIRAAELIIAVGVAVDWRSRVHKPTAQSRPKPVILCFESDVISEMGFSVFSFVGSSGLGHTTEELWVWLIAWEELGTVYLWVLSFLSGLDLWS
jgi:hypothetical protein